MLDFLMPPKGVNPKKLFRQTGIIALIAAALAVVWPHASLWSAAMAFLGGALSTFLYAPLQRLRVAPKRAAALSTAALVVSILGWRLGLGHSTAPWELATRFLGGAVFFGAIIVADRMRALTRESA
jgi:hypothetical protein